MGSGLRGSWEARVWSVGLGFRGLGYGYNMLVSYKGGPQYRPQHTRPLITLDPQPIYPCT